MSSQVFTSAVATAKDSVEASEKVFAEATMSTMIMGLLRGTGPTVKQIAAMGYDKIGTGEALERVHNKLPEEVVALLKASHGRVPTNATAGAPVHSEESLQKALKILNDMIFQAWLALDDELIKCKEFQERNRGSFDQVMTDLQRLAQQVSDLERQRIEANEGKELMSMEFSQTSEAIITEGISFTKTRLENQKELDIRNQDLAVMDYILLLTRCPDGPGPAALLQVEGVATPSQGSAAVRVCEEGGTGGFALHFDDPKMEAEVESRMTPAARQAIQEMLHRIASPQPSEMVLAQETKWTPQAPAIPKTPVQKQRDLQSTGQWKKCSNGTPNCGLLYDNLSIMWGEFKDKVDELQLKMDKNQADFRKSQANLQQQSASIGFSKGRFMMMIAEVTSNLNGDQAETGQKEQQRGQLDKDYIAMMTSCRSTITEILFTNICGVRKVRNEVMATSTVVKVSDIVDCDTTDWKPTPCSMECDDKCPMKDPYACGGWQTLKRNVVENATQFGVQCPPLQRKKKCNQFKCPVNCELSMFSGWSKCTKECESGVQTKTRAIITKPKNGGSACDNVQEPRPCNTGSCDRDCKMDEWTNMSPCSMACGGGLQSRVRKVLVPTRGAGECPKKDAPARLHEQSCNEMRCNGDEICIAQQDLILAIDGSGSLRLEGFKAIQTFAAKLVDRYEANYYGNEAMRVGVVLFGNGHVLDDGTVSGAILVHELSDDMASVKASIEALQWQKGFTNMEQALGLAERMWQLKGRKDAQSAVALITDGKPSFQFQTNQKIMQLKDQQTKILFAPISRFEGKELELMKKWASQPWESHLVHIPGLLPLEADPDVFAGMLVATFCPMAVSPMAEFFKEKEIGFFLLRENGRCGVRGDLLGTGQGDLLGTDTFLGTSRTFLTADVETAGDCALLARAKGVKAFSLGTWVAKGKCYAENMEVSEEKITAWQSSRQMPNCDETGGWIEDRLFDMYVLE